MLGIRSKIALVFAAFIWGSLLAPHCSAQQTATLPTGWQQMNPTDLATAMRPFIDGGTFKFLSQSDQGAVRASARQFYAQINFATTTLNYGEAACG